MKYIIDMPEDRYKDIQRIASVQLKKRTDTVEQIIANGIPVEEFDNPCIYCGDNYCSAEYQDKRCECQKVFMIKEKNNGT